MQSKTINFLYTLVLGWPGIGLADKLFDSQRNGYFLRVRLYDVWENQSCMKIIRRIL